MTDPQPLPGHCLCGAVRFAARPPFNWVSHCHCEDCRRATASPMTTFVSVPVSQLTWEGKIATIRSRANVERGFCPACGSPLYYRRDDIPDETHIYAALLDDPAAVTPTEAEFENERIAWMQTPPLP